MGFFKNKNQGMHCEALQDGSGVTCAIYERDKNHQKVDLGNHFSITATEQTNCEPMFLNAFDLDEEQEAKAEKMAKKVKQACQKRRGLA